MQKSFSVPAAFLTALLLAFAVPLPAMSNSDSSEAAPVELVDRLALDGLFEKLQFAADPGEASGITDEIWTIWTSPSDPELAARMREIERAALVRDFALAIALSSDVIRQWPDYAEGWNRRATYEFFMGDYDASLADVLETLAREPRHFGALSGGAFVQLRLGNRTGALEFMIEGLKVHPFLGGRELFPELLTPQTRT
jgi:tetratricopeptide (TPR) repeat protein